MGSPKDRDKREDAPSRLSTSGMSPPPGRCFGTNVRVWRVLWFGPVKGPDSAGQNTPGMVLGAAFPLCLVPALGRAVGSVTGNSGQKS